MNARKAYEAASAVKNAKSAKDESNVRDLIWNACLAGHLSIRSYKSISSDVIEKLQNDGYKVEDNSSQRDGQLYIISWNVDDI